MRILLDIVFFIILGYFCSRFAQVLLKMRQKIIFPVTNEEVTSIRKHLDKVLDVPTYSKQKVGIIIYFVMLLFVVVVYFLGVYFDVFTFSFSFLLILPFTYSFDVLNLFAFTEDGVLSGVRFIKWNKIKSFQFIPIEVNHKFYVFSKEANHGYELKMTTTGIPIRCVVTSEEMKERVKILLGTYLKDSSKNVQKGRIAE